MKHWVVVVLLTTASVAYADKRSDFADAMRFLPEMAAELERREQATHRKMVSFAVVSVVIAGGAFVKWKLKKGK